MLAIVTILLCAGLLFAGNGLFQTLLPIRAGQEGYTAAMIGVMGTAYFGGFTIGCFVGPRLISAVGHVRGEWAKFGGYAAALWYAPVRRPSRTAARTTATRWAPLGDHLIRRRFPMRVLPMSSTQPSARDEEIGSPARCRRP